MRIEDRSHFRREVSSTEQNKVAELQDRRRMASHLLTTENDEACRRCSTAVSIETSETYERPARYATPANNTVKANDNEDPHCGGAIEPPSADVNGDGVVDVHDIELLLKHWGTCDSTYDLTGNGTVDVSDLLYLLSQWTMPDNEPSTGDTVQDSQEENMAALRRRRWAASQPSDDSDNVSDAMLRRRRYAAAEKSEDNPSDLRRLMASSLSEGRGPQVSDNRSLEDLLAMISSTAG